MKVHAPFVNRSDELEMLGEHLEAAHAGLPRLVLIEGAPGIGKSALLEAFARGQERRVRRRVGFYYLHPPEEDEYSPIRHAALAATDQKLYRRLGGKRQATRVARGLFKEWLGAIPIWGNLIAAITATLEVVGRRRGSARTRFELGGDEFVEALVDASRRRPIVLLLDQLESARSESIDHLDRLVSRAATGCRLLVVGTYRPPPPGGMELPIGRLRRRLSDRGTELAYRRLGPLGENDLADALRLRFSGAAIPEGFTEWLHSATGGHPQLFHDTLTHLQFTRAIRRELGRWRIDPDPARLEPPPVSDFAELQDIDPQLRETLATAAAFGDEFHVLELAERLGRDELELEDELAGAGHLGLLVHAGERELASGDLTTVYRFASSHLRAELARRPTPQHLPD